jgi:uncharacterized protein with NRDE domain
MCLILLAWNARREHPLILAANRDEFFARATRPAAPWPESPAVIGGRDLEKGGSWLAVSASGRLAAVTNFRDGARRRSGQRSRGLLVSDFVLSDLGASSFLTDLRARRDVYDGFNLLVAADGELLHYSNVSDEITAVAAGIHGLSNHLLDTPWPKVERGKRTLARLLGGTDDALAAGLFDALADTHSPPDGELPRTGVSLQWERALGRAFIRTPEYGTRASTVVLMERSGQLTFLERNFAANGEAAETRAFQLSPGRALEALAWTLA